MKHQEFKGIYKGARPIVPGFLMWYMTFQSEDGKQKHIKIYYDKLMDFLETSTLKKGNRVMIDDNGDTYKITVLDKK